MVTLKERSPEARQAYFEGYRAGIEAAAKEAACEYGDECDGPACPEHKIARRILALASPPPHDAPRSERREGEPAVTVESMYAAYGAPPAAPKEEAK